MPLNRSNYSRFSFTRTNGDAEPGQESMNSNYQPSIFLKSYNHNEQIQPLDQSDVSKVDESAPSNSKVDKNRTAGKEKKRQKHDAKARIDNFNEQTVELLQESHFATNHSHTINHGEDDEMEITGFRRSLPRTTLCYLGFILTLGILRLVMHWWRHWLLLATHTPCQLHVATHVLIRENYQGKHIMYYVKKVHTMNAESVQRAQMLHEESMKKKKNKKPANQTEEMDEIAESLHQPPKEFFGQPFYLPTHLSGGVFKNVESLRFFICKKLRYIWDTNTNSFVKLRGLDEDVPSVLLHQQKGLTQHEQYIRRLVYGVNQISIPLKSILTLLFLEALNPFYVFQVFSVCLWFSYNYYYYATVIVIMSAAGITLSIRQTRKNQLALYNTVHSTDTITVIRKDGTSQTIDSKLLVPGDVLEIPAGGCTMQCDAVLQSGNCILDESMLTGESVPVTKTPLPMKRNSIYHSKEHARHTLFSGTKVIQTRYIGNEKVLAVVINTGNITAKGGLIRSILYPPPVDFKFEQDSYKFVGLLGCIAFIGFVYTLVTKISRGVPAGKIAIEALDLITIAVPPALPAAMSVGRMFAQHRLQSNNIYCISPRSINVAGSIDCVCFDKTGTLTEDGLDMWAVVPKSATNSFQIPLSNVERLPFDHFLYGMVTCHSITIMNGERRGDPLDVKMFESTGWILEEANVADNTKYDLLFPTYVKPPARLIDNAKKRHSTEIDQHEIGILREFSFTSSLQRMSVVTRKVSDKHFNIYCKGSPEIIHTLCKPESIPNDFNYKLDYYAQQGYRIIALAYKKLDKKITYAKVQRLSRDKAESDLEFLGFVILENRLKDDTTDVIGSLTAANIRTVMVTGDNILTALSVAKNCGMIRKGQSVITVNVRIAEEVGDSADDKQSNTDSEKFEVFYTLAGQSGTAVENDNQFLSVHGDTTDHGTKLSNGCGGVDYGLMTKSSSLETVTDTNTQMMTMSNSRTQEFSINIEEPEDVEDDADMRLDRELPNNNYRFALVGKTWAVLKDNFPELLPKICTRGTIFARMSPDQKQALISELQDLGYYVAMCGDGANDCGALKAAHTGISLSEAESSVASPFTSRNPTIACVPNIIKEGRTALVTSFGIFKYMAAYSLVQFASVLILYSIDSNLTDFQFLYIDLFLISVFALFFGRTSSYDGPLVKQTPLNSLISLSPIVSLILQVMLAITFQVVGWYHVQSMEWFEPFNYTEIEGEAEHLGCHQNFTIFAISAFQYVTLAIVFSKGAPYRKSIVSNLPLLFSIIGNIIFAVYLILYPAVWLANQFELIVPPDLQFRALLLAYGLVNFILAVIVEAVLIEFLLFKKMRYRFHKIDKSRRKFLAVENHLRTDSKWPPLCLHPADIVSSESATEQGDKQSPLSFAEILVEEQLDQASTLDHGASILNIFFEQPPNGTGGDGDGDEVCQKPVDNSIQSVTCVVKDQEITLNPKALKMYANEQNSSLTNITNHNNNNAVEKAMPMATTSELEPMSSVNAPRS